MSVVVDWVVIVPPGFMCGGEVLIIGEEEKTVHNACHIRDDRSW